MCVATSAQVRRRIVIASGAVVSLEIQARAVRVFVVQGLWWLYRLNAFVSERDGNQVI
jgi:hypothetical protein